MNRANIGSSWVVSSSFLLHLSRQRRHESTAVVGTAVVETTRVQNLLNYYILSSKSTSSPLIVCNRIIAVLSKAWRHFRFPKISMCTRTASFHSHRAITAFSITLEPHLKGGDEQHALRCQSLLEEIHPHKRRLSTTAWYPSILLDISTSTSTTT